MLTLAVGGGAGVLGRADARGGGGGGGGRGRRVVAETGGARAAAGRREDRRYDADVNAHATASCWGSLRYAARCSLGCCTASRGLSNPRCQSPRRNTTRRRRNP